MLHIRRPHKNEMYRNKVLTQPRLQLPPFGNFFADILTKKNYGGHDVKRVILDAFKSFPQDEVGAFDLMRAIATEAGDDGVLCVLLTDHVGVRFRAVLDEARHVGDPRIVTDFVEGAVQQLPMFEFHITNECYEVARDQRVQVPPGLDALHNSASGKCKWFHERDGWTAVRDFVDKIDERGQLNVRNHVTRMMLKRAIESRDDAYIGALSDINAHYDFYLGLDYDDIPDDESVDGIQQEDADTLSAYRIRTVEKIHTAIELKDGRALEAALMRGAFDMWALVHDLGYRFFGYKRVLAYGLDEGYNDVVGIFEEARTIHISVLRREFGDKVVDEEDAYEFIVKEIADWPNERRDTIDVCYEMATDLGIKSDRLEVLRARVLAEMARASDSMYVDF